MRIAYIVSRYPYVSHTFILREVLALRRRGVAIDTFTVRRPDREDLRTVADREADATTHALLPARPVDLLLSHLLALLTRPRAYLATLRLAVSLRHAGARSALWQLFYFGESALLWRQCRRRGIHHIHAHHGNVASDVALLATRLGGRGWSWSFTMHGPTELFDVRESRLREKVALARLVVCVSEHGRSQVMIHTDPRHWAKLHVVHCGVEPSQFPAAEREDRAELEILTIGRAVAMKGQALLVEALAELMRRGLRVRLTIVGDGPELPALRAQAEREGVCGRVSFLGAVGQDEVPGLLARADIFALPSFAEGLPVVLMEAMCTGLPVVATHITGIPELVRDGVSGLLVAPGRAAPLADALVALVGDSRRRASIGHAGRAAVLAEFDVAQSAARLEALFASIVCDSDTRPA